jgi:bis(5'-nucleosyl)-tetraphosphatase (symmetrical)
MVHAGLLPQWSLDEATSLAREVETVLSGGDYRSFLHELFHGPVTTWDPSLNGLLRLATLARIFTRIRTCTPAGDTSSFSGPPGQAPAGYHPWFRLPHSRGSHTTLVTGHWAALGLQVEPTHLAIDSGCVWGRKLTAVRLEDREIFQVDGVAKSR